MRVRQHASLLEVHSGDLTRCGAMSVAAKLARLLRPSPLRVTLLLALSVVFVASLTKDAWSQAVPGAGGPRGF